MRVTAIATPSDEDLVVLRAEDIGV
jgi:hypothetical protein